MTRTTKIVFISLTVLIILALIILILLGLILTNSIHPEERSISHEYLQSVMTDDVVYLSDDFLTANSLEWQLTALHSDGLDVDVIYNSNKDRNPDFTQKIKSAEYYSYMLKSTEDSDGIPVIVRVLAQKGNDTSSLHKYDNEYGGYKYSIFDQESTGYKIYYIKATPKKFATCTLSISVKIENKSEYTDEQIKAREEEIFKSAVDNIIKYQG